MFSVAVSKLALNIGGPREDAQTQKIDRTTGGIDARIHIYCHMGPRGPALRDFRIGAPISRNRQYDVLLRTISKPLGLCVLPYYNLLRAFNSGIAKMANNVGIVS